MSDSEKIRALVNARMQQADNALSAGELLLQQDFYSDSSNRFYYAMFYAVLALLVIRQLEASKHQGAISLFEREFVRPGTFPKELSRGLRRTFEQRLEADYTELVDITAEDAQEANSHAQIFIRRVQAYLDDFLSNLGNS